MTATLTNSVAKGIWVDAATLRRWEATIDAIRADAIRLGNAETDAALITPLFNLSVEVMHAAFAADCERHEALVAASAAV